jgi:mono/diheme cytochrome c family protein
MTRILIVAAGFLAFAGPAAGQAPNTSEETGIERGESVYTYWCATCHSAGPRMPGTAALEAKYNGSTPAVLTERTDLTEEMIHSFVRNGVSVMPPFRKTEITDADLRAMTEYLIDRDPD